MPADKHIALAAENLQTHVIPFIEAHPETEFDFFFPPYSAAEWSTMKSKGSLYAMLALRGRCYDMLSAYPNVHIYDFSAREDWVLCLDNYKDTLHYGEWINAAIVECIASDENEVTDRAQIDDASSKLQSWAEELIAAGHWIYQ